MRIAVVICLFLSTACAKGHDPLSQPAQSEVCVPPESVTQLQEVTFPDGVVRKCTVSSCSDGCTRYAWVNDVNLYLTACGQ